MICIREVPKHILIEALANVGIEANESNVFAVWNEFVFNRRARGMNPQG